MIKCCNMNSPANFCGAWSRMWMFWQEVKRNSEGLISSDDVLTSNSCDKVSFTSLFHFWMLLCYFVCHSFDAILGSFHSVSETCQPSDWVSCGSIQWAHVSLLMMGLLKGIDDLDLAASLHYIMFALVHLWISIWYNMIVYLLIFVNHCIPKSTCLNPCWKCFTTAADELWRLIIKHIGPYFEHTYVNRKESMTDPCCQYWIQP